MNLNQTSDFINRLTESKYFTILIFLTFLFVRAGFAVFSGYDNYELQHDSGRYILLADKILEGDFNFDIIIFIVAPFYPLFVSLHKFLFPDNWQAVLSSSQIIISSISGVYLYKIANILFPKSKIPFFTVLVYCFFPTTFYWVHTFAQEIIFQSLLIFFVYAFLVALNEKNSIKFIISAAVFSLTFLTKSHILLFSPFIVIAIYLFYKKSIKLVVKYSVIFASVCLLFTLPFGIINYKIHDTYTLSGNGAQFHFYMGNTQYAYDWIVNTPPYGSKEYWHLNMFEGSMGSGSVHDSITKLPHKLKQGLYFKESLKWIESNPGKYLELKWVNFYKFILPGVSFSHYPIKTALLLFLISFPVYLGAYYGVFMGLRTNLRTHFWIVGLFSAMLIFSVVFYVQNRFRTITIEPFYLMYAVYGFSLMFRKFKK